MSQQLTFPVHTLEVRKLKLVRKPFQVISHLGIRYTGIFDHISQEDQVVCLSRGQLKYTRMARQELMDQCSAGVPRTVLLNAIILSTPTASVGSVSSRSLIGRTKI